MTWRHPGWRDFLNQGQYLTVQSPLRTLPVHVLTELAEAVLDDLGSAPHILHSVIQPQLTRIRLPPNLRTVPLAVKLMVERTTSLASLELTSCRSINPLVVAAVLPYLSNLTHLNVEGTQFDDFGLSQLCGWVPGLVTLNLARTKITDTGLTAAEDKLQDLSFCIILGNIRSVSPPAVLSFLRSHRNLLTLEYEQMRDVLWLLSEDEEDSAQFSCSLRKIILENCREDFERVLEKCIHCFPLLEALSFNNCNLDLVMLSPVSECAHLSKLELGNSVTTQYTVSLVETVLPLLNIIGAQLSHLSLENFKFFDVATIGRLCPKLVSLKLSNILSYCRAENQKFRAFSNLEELCIFNTRLGNITEGMLRQLLSGYKLKIGPELLLDLLKIPANLRALHCWSCSNITSSTQQQISQYIEHSNLDVNFQWSEFRDDEIAANILNEEDDLQNLLLPLININVLPNVD